MKIVIAYILLLLTAFHVSQCTSKGESIIEPKFGTYEFTTYTADTFRFKVVLNGETLTDSLLSPRGGLSKIVKFFDPTGRLQIFDAGNEQQVVLDTTIQMKIGTTSISIVQFRHGEKPTPPSVPNEPPPAPGNYKVRFQYIKPTSSAVPFFDTVKCVVFDYNGMSIDTVDLGQYGLTPFYEAKINYDFTIRLYDKANFSPLHNGPVAGGLSIQSEVFKTAVFYGTGKAGNLYTFKVEPAY